MSTGLANKKSIGISKLPKGEFPTNIHILKGATNEEGAMSRGVGSKGGSRKPGKLFNDLTLQTLPKFKDVQAPHRHELFRAKLKACCVICNFKDEKVEVELKEQKKNTLLELVDYLNADNTVFNSSVLKALMVTVNANLFRTLG